MAAGLPPAAGDDSNPCCPCLATYTVRRWLSLTKTPLVIPASRVPSRRQDALRIVEQTDDRIRKAREIADRSCNVLAGA